MNEEQLKELFKGVINELVPDQLKSAIEAHTKGITTEVDALKEQVSKAVELSKIVGASGKTFDDAQKLKAKTAIVNAFKTIFKSNIASEEAASEVLESEIKAAFMNEGTATEGAEYVFDEFSKDVLYVMKKYPLVNELSLFQTKGKTLSIPTWENTVEASWEDEGAEYDQSKGKTGKVSFTAKKLASFVTVTDEMLDDGMTVPALYDLIIESIGSTQASKIEEGMFSGATGAGMEGILTHSDTASVALPSGVTTVRGATADQLDNLVIDADLAISEEYLTDAPDLVIAMSRYVLAQFKKKKTSDGKYAFPELRESNPTLLGKYRVITSSKAPCQNLAADVAGADLFFLGNVKRFYKGIRRKGLTFTRGYADGDFRGGRESIRAEQRVNGKPWTGKAFAKGKNAAS